MILGLNITFRNRCFLFPRFEITVILHVFVDIYVLSMHRLPILRHRETISVTIKCIRIAVASCYVTITDSTMFTMVYTGYYHRVQILL